MSPRTEETNQRIREEQKERILKAARKVFAYKGVADTKMTDIAAAAGVSYGLTYHYFKDKEEIFTKLVEQALNSSLALIQRAKEQTGTPWERLHWLTSTWLEGSQRNPEAFMVVLQAFTNDTVPQEARELAWRSSVASLELTRQLIVEGQASGEVAAGNPEHLANVFGWCIQGMALGIGFLNRQPPDVSIFPATSLPSADDILRILKA